VDVALFTRAGGLVGLMQVMQVMQVMQ